MTTGTERADGWAEEALCADKPTAWFFPERDDMARSYARGRLVCNACPVAAECLADALETGEGFGLRGGLTPQERTRYRLRARLG